MSSVTVRSPSDRAARTALALPSSSTSWQLMRVTSLRCIGRERSDVEPFVPVPEIKGKRLFEMESDYADLLIIDKFSFIIFCFYSHYYYHLIIFIICLTINLCNKDILDYQYMQPRHNSAM